MKLFNLKFGAKLYNKYNILRLVNCYHSMTVTYRFLFSNMVSYMKYIHSIQKNKMADENNKILTNGTNHSTEEEELEGIKTLFVY